MTAVPTPPPTITAWPTFSMSVARPSGPTTSETESPASSSQEQTRRRTDRLDDQRDGFALAVGMRDGEWDPLALGDDAHDDELARAAVPHDVRGLDDEPAHFRRQPFGLKNPVSHGNLPLVYARGRGGCIRRRGHSANWRCWYMVISWRPSIRWCGQGARMIETVADFENLCGECPVWDAESKSLYWTDCSGRKFFRYRDGKPEQLHDGLEITGFRLNQSGGFTIANAGGVWLWDGVGDPVPVCTEVEGHRCQLNDCTADPAGRFIAGTCFYDPAKEYQKGKLIRIDTDGTATVLDEGFDLSNGLAFSPDQRTLYFADSVARRIHAYDYSVETGTTKNARVFVQVPSTEGLPDGLAVDAEGFVWAAHWYGSCVVRYDPDGKIERRIEVPAKQASSLTFGGPDLTDIFITSAARSEPMPVQPRGYDAEHGFFGGPLFHINAGIPGQPAFRTRLKIPQTSRK